MGDVSRNFSYSEFKVSRRFPHLAERIVLHKDDKLKIFWITHLFLQPLRDSVNRSSTVTNTSVKIFIESGIRSRELNTSVSGVTNSDHLFKNNSCAVDIRIGDNTRQYLDLAYAFVMAREKYVKQFIYYLSSAGNFIHLSTIDGGGKVGDVLYCSSRENRRYFRTLEEAEDFQRGVNGG